MRRLHQRGDDPARGLPGHRGPRRPVLRLRPRDRALRHVLVGVRGPGGARRGRRRASTASRRERRRPGHPQRGRGVGPGAGRRARDGRPRRRHGARPGAPGRDAAAPALRVPGAQAALRPLHPGDGAGRLRRATGDVPAGLRGGDREQRAASAPRAGSTRSAGRTTRSACSTSAPRRSSSCCWATSAARAAASWRCAVTPASRARPTSRRCSTCCPGYLPMPKAGEHDTLDDYVDSIVSPTQKGFWARRRRLRGQPAQGLVGRRGHRGERLRLRLPAAADRRPRHLPDRHGHARRQGRGLLRASARTRRSARRTAGCSGSAWRT